MKILDSEIEVTQLTDAEKDAIAPRYDDATLAREYAEMMENAYLDSEELDLETCPPDRRYFRGDKEAWVYEHGNIAELVFVK